MSLLFKPYLLLVISTGIIGCLSIKEKSVGMQTEVQSSTIADSTTVIRYQHLAQLLQNADSILLVSHEQTYGQIFNKKNDSYTETERLVENGMLNRKLINKTVVIEGKEKDSLISILTQPVIGEQIDQARCFDPRHAIIVISKKDVAYLEICFACTGVSTDKLDISTADFDKAKWDAMYRFIDCKIAIE
jgi:hypothetical protein